MNPNNYNMMDLRVTDVVLKRISDIPEGKSIRDAAKTMEKNGSTYVLVKNSDGEIVGIVTEGDLKRAISNDISVRESVKSIMSKPIIKIDSDSMLWEAIIEFFRNKIQHLPVETNGKIVGVLSIRDIVFFNSPIPLYFLKEVSRANNIDDVKELYNRFQNYMLQILPRELEKENIDLRYIGNIISMINDEIIRVIIRLSIKKKKIDEEEFTFFVMGSEGRREQFLKTDQDNGIIFSDEKNREKFISLGREIHGSLLKIGFADCPAGYTAGNEEFVKSLKDWLSTVEHWSYNLSAEDILNFFVFGDMRYIYGNKELFLRIRERLYSLCKNENIFRKLLQTSLEFSIPSKPKKIDLKNEALLPIIAPIRVLSMRFGVYETNTVDRIEKLKEKKVLSDELATDLKVAYIFLKNLHFQTQVRNIKNEKNKHKINFIDVKNDLPKIKAKFLEDSLRTISEFHNLIGGKFIYYFVM
ncbi:MAG: hypothetical protein DRO94_04245 [Candidatus Altiarchaeales archaeon]|nr:MAG: hypothetical protein DRO94_04245 [Candidatus Altiarchaeales archaeon]